MELFVSELPYTYGVDVPELAAGQQFIGYFRIQEDSHFLARQRVVKVMAENAAGEQEQNQPIPEATVEVKDMASGRAFMREPVMISNWFGRGFFPYKIPLGGKVFYKSQTIEVTVVNVSGAKILPMSLRWQGEKIFTTGMN